MWNKKVLTPESDMIYIGDKQPMYYAFSIASIIKKRGHCIVMFEESMSYIFNGKQRTMEMQWKDVSRLLNDAFEAKIISDKHGDEGQRTIKLIW